MVQTFAKRPVSPLHYEPLEPSPEDICWPGSDDEADEGHREKKRVRVELLGKQYLEGRPLFIQSAGLRGPFDRGWVNPWAGKKRRYEEDIQSFNNIDPQVVKQSIYNQAEAPKSLPRARRRSVRDAEIGSLRERQANETIQEDLGVKRRRLEEAADSMWVNTGGNASAVLPEVGGLVSGVRAGRTQDNGSYKGPWLKTDHKFLQSRSVDDAPLSTPTPTVRPRDRSRDDSVADQQLSIAATEVRQSWEIDGSGNDDVLVLQNKSIGKRSASSAKKASRQHTTRISPESSQSSETKNAQYKSPETRIKTINLSRTDHRTRNGYEAVKRLSQEAATRRAADDPELYNLSPEAVARSSQGTGKPTPSRLAPYVSEFDLKDDAATSAGLRAVKKAPTPKPSPHAAPASTYLPEFQYRYSTKGLPSHSSQAKRSSAGAPQVPQIRSRSESMSSSGSSDFVKEFEAAQAKASAKSIGSSFSSSPIKERYETTSVKKNTQAMKRLTFTASGEPRIDRSRPSSRPSSRSSAAGQPDLSPIRVNGKSKKRRERLSTQKESTKFSNPPLTNGAVSRNSVVLPEAQVVSDGPIKLAQLPSAPSIDLIETDKQSPKIISLDDEDSYLDLSTQAAMYKAQRSFKEDITSPIKVKISPSQHLHHDFSRPVGADVTPIANERPTRAVEREVVKPEPFDDIEPMSTQAMADAISPFAVTTIKRRAPAPSNGAGFGPAPNRARSPSAAKNQSPNPSLVGSFHKPISMSTTPSSSQTPSSQPKPSPPIPLSNPNTTSKPLSTLTSFSVLPNGTMDESSVHQDGQQSQHSIDSSLPLDPFETPFATANGNGDQSNGSWDLNEAIEDAGSFLGDWDVEAEARKEGSERRRRDVGVRGILSVGNRNS